MTDNTPTKFNITNSLWRMDNILRQTGSDYCEKERIPAADSLNYKDGCYVTCAVLCIDIRDSSILSQTQPMPVLAKIYRAYISETIALIKSCALHRHIRIDGDAVMGIFDVPLPGQHIKDIFELAGKASSLMRILNDKLIKCGYPPIRVGIGLSFGRVLMIKAGYSGSGYSDIIWMGDAINRASKLSGYGNKEPTKGDQEIMVSHRFYEKMNHPTYQGFLAWSAFRQCYTGGDIWDRTIQAAHEAMNRPKPVSLPPAIPPSVPFSLAPSFPVSTDLASLFSSNELMRALGAVSSPPTSDLNQLLASALTEKF